VRSFGSRTRSRFLTRCPSYNPTLGLLRTRADFYSSAHPGAADVLLLIEVADSTLRLDRRVKIPLYARAGITEAWLLDLTTEHVEGALRRSASPTSPSPSTTCSADTGGRT
jgi:hypothetical protein